MEEWKTYRLGEICTFSQGIQVDVELQHYEDSPERVRFIRIVDVTQNNERPRYINNPGNKYIISKDDIAMVRYGAVGQLCYGYEGAIANNLFRIIPIDSKAVNKKFLYYCLSQASVQRKIRGENLGSALPAISFKVIKNIELSLPPLPLQRRISSLLSSLDAKIETNRRINARLEEMAQALFRSWFIDFTPFKQQEFVEDEYGRRPKGWEVGTVEDLCINLASGSTPSSMNSAYYSGEIKWFTTKELKDSFLLDSEKHISEEAHNNSSTKMFPKGTVLMAIYAAPTVGRLGILTCDATFNQAAVGLLPKKEVGTYYMYLYLKNERDTFNRLAVGAAQQNLSVKFVKTYKTIIPPTNILLDFNSKITPLFEKIKVCEQEISRLAALRDTLLPKLMSGEIIPEEITASRATRFL